MSRCQLGIICNRGKDKLEVGTSKMRLPDSQITYMSKLRCPGDSMTTSDSNLVFHVLSARRTDELTITAKGSVRVGQLADNALVHFTTPEGRKHKLRLVKATDSRKFTSLLLSGDKTALDDLKGGFYLYAD